jgi:hypothetical protein
MEVRSADGTEIAFERLGKGDPVVGLSRPVNEADGPQ